VRVLFVVPYAPTRIRTRPFHMIRALRSVGHDVTVATLWTGEEERTALADAARCGDVLAEPLSVARSLWNCLRALPRAEPLQAHFSWSPALAARLAQAVTTTPFDVVHVEHLRGVRYGLWLKDVLATSARRPALVWDSVDCISALFRRASRESEVWRARLAARLELSRTERYEASMMSRFDRILVTAERDRKELLALAPAGREASVSRVEVVPNGVDLEYFAPTSEVREPMTLVITGKMSYHANATAVSRFVRDTMPSVWKQMPDVRLWIVGKDPTAEVLALGKLWPAPFGSRQQDEGPHSRVLITGTVDDIRPFIRRAALAVAPIQYGVGIQNKVLEAMACGTPVVATPQAVEGVGASLAGEVVVSATPGQMAQDIVALLGNPERRAALGGAGRAYVERQHSWGSAAARLTDIYEHARES
jgi:glycosyltransferase involved in cell wall biosynthesis